MCFLHNQLILVFLAVLTSYVKTLGLVWSSLFTSSHDITELQPNIKLAFLPNMLCRQVLGYSFCTNVIFTCSILTTPIVVDNDAKRHVFISTLNGRCCLIDDTDGDVVVDVDLKAPIFRCRCHKYCFFRLSSEQVSQSPFSLRDHGIDIERSWG